ncbi:MAG: Mrp/NBP35 family ATP-binding protein [Firmicutes bacterium]|nr:Mrp/NBP35 family ATP-binding protein [Bacillota bacterium]
MSEGEKCGTCDSKAEGCSPDNCGTTVLPQNEVNDIKHVIGVMSGKGGVGKSSVSALAALSLARKGYLVGILDADITGPSIPKMFGLKEHPRHAENFLYPVMSRAGIAVMSLNLLLEQEDQPVIWRGPIIAGAVKQFWTDVAWGGLDYLVVDMPPGTGDVPLTVMQSLPLEALVIVTSPQDLANMVVKKAINMARQMNIPILGLVENMSCLHCPDCGREINIFGAGHTDGLLAATGLRMLEKLPLDPGLAELCDAGLIEDYQGELFNDLDRLVEALPAIKTG